MGRAKGWITSSCAGARVAGRDGELGLTYVPAHTVNGKLYNQRVTFTVYVNSTKGIGRDGSPGRSDRFQFVAYGALADSICRSLSNGKAIDCVLKPHSYQGRSFDANRTMRLEQDGSPVLVEKVGFQIVESPTYGEDSAKTIELEVAAGRRPVNWNVQNHQDSATWIQMLKDRANVQYIPGNPAFGYAKVITPQGQGIVPVAQAQTGPAARAAASIAKGGNTQIPPQNTQASSAVTPNPVAIDQGQLAALIAQVMATQATGNEVTPPAQGIDPKTGFATNTGNNSVPF